MNQIYAPLGQLFSADGRENKKKQRREFMRSPPECPRRPTGDFLSHPGSAELTEERLWSEEEPLALLLKVFSLPGLLFWDWEAA